MLWVGIVLFIVPVHNIVQKSICVLWIRPLKLKARVDLGELSVLIDIPPLHNSPGYREKYSINIMWIFDDPKIIILEEEV